jgi:hypothetical protein
MTELLLYGSCMLFLLIYMLSTLLMVGYDHMKYKDSREKAGMMVSDYFRKAFRLRPLLQRQLEPKGYDYKLYSRFQKRFTKYYIALWILLFAILFLSAKVYLNAFN